MKPIRFIALPLMLALQCAWSQSPASAPGLSRAEVKAELDAARKDGVIPLNEEGEMPRDLDPKAFPPKTAQPPATRAEVKSELSAARKAGDLPVGDEGKTARDINPSAYPAKPMPAGLTRDQVKAEAKAALRAGEIPIGETGETPAQENPSRYAGAPATPPKLHLPHRKPKAAASAPAANK